MTYLSTGGELVRQGGRFSSGFEPGREDFGRAGSHRRLLPPPPRLVRQQQSSEFDQLPVPVYL